MTDGTKMVLDNSIINRKVRVERCGEPSKSSRGELNITRHERLSSRKLAVLLESDLSGSRIARSEIVVYQPGKYLISGPVPGFGDEAEPEIYSPELVITEMPSIGGECLLTDVQRVNVAGSECAQATFESLVSNDKVTGGSVDPAKVHLYFPEGAEVVVGENKEVGTTTYFIENTRPTLPEPEGVVAYHVFTIIKN